MILSYFVTSVIKILGIAGILGLVLVFLAFIYSLSKRILMFAWIITLFGGFLYVLFT